MLDPLPDWVDRLKQMPSVGTSQEGAENLANFYGDLADKVTAEGSPPLFTFNRQVFASTLLSQGFGPTGGTEWVQKIGTAFEAGVAQGTITPALKADPRWTASGSDVQTPSTGASVILTLSIARSTLESGLISATQGFSQTENSDQADSSQEKFAQAWRDATLEFQFTLIGLIVVPPSGTAPLPLTFNAQ